ncbi:MAG: hypothetical protein LBD41_03705 [Clostridiales Family XIII bacterium]|jgi:hypothetical protein|nr:hypothetical protein [Clostridiales Family XIII bacterium]
MMERIVNNKKILALLLVSVLTLFLLTGCSGEKDVLKVNGKTFESNEVIGMIYYFAFNNNVDLKAKDIDVSIVNAITSEAIKVFEKYQLIQEALKKNEDSPLDKDWKKKSLESAKSAMGSWSKKDKEKREKEGVTSKILAYYMGLYAYLQPAYQTVIAEKEPISQKEINEYYKTNKANYKGKKKADRDTEIAAYLEYTKFEEAVDKLIAAAKIEEPKSIKL